MPCHPGDRDKHGSDQHQGLSGPCFPLTVSDERGLLPQGHSYTVCMSQHDSPAVLRESCGQLSGDQRLRQTPHKGQHHEADQRQKRPC